MSCYQTPPQLATSQLNQTKILILSFDEMSTQELLRSNQQDLLLVRHTNFEVQHSQENQGITCLSNCDDFFENCVCLNNFVIYCSNLFEIVVNLNKTRKISKIIVRIFYFFVKVSSNSCHIATKKSATALQFNSILFVFLNIFLFSKSEYFINIMTSIDSEEY